VVEATRMELEQTMMSFVKVLVTDAEKSARFYEALGFRVDLPGLDEVASRARAQGASVDGPVVQPWHTRELVVTDPNGHRLNFIEPA
jgi:lactoylglutathione lyase